MKKIFIVLIILLALVLSGCKSELDEIMDQMNENGRNVTPWIEEYNKADGIINNEVEESGWMEGFSTKIENYAQAQAAMKELDILTEDMKNSISSDKFDIINTRFSFVANLLELYYEEESYLENTTEE